MNNQQRSVPTNGRVKYSIPTQRYNSNSIVRQAALSTVVI